MTDLIIAIVALLIASAFFSATETAFTSLNKIRIKNMAQSGDARAKKVLNLSEKYDQLLSTILVGNNLVNISLTALATVLFVELYPEHAAAAATIVTTVVVLVFGEVSPKTLAKEHAEQFACFSAPILQAIMWILTPINMLFSLWKKLLAVIFKKGEEEGYTEDELITIVEEAETEGSIGEEQSELIQNAIEFNDLEVWDVLTPRVDVSAISQDATIDEVDKLFIETGYSRLPVYEEDLDNVIGVLNQKDFSNYIKGKENSFAKFVKPVVYVAGSMKISLLLKKMQTAKTHIAIIVDEYGGTAGIVTMEDIIEELVGDIYDEHDKTEVADIVPLYGGAYRVQTDANLDKFFDYFDVEAKYDATTVNGWICILLDRLPKVGDTFDELIEGKRFSGRVTKADERKSIEIYLKVNTEEVKE